MRLRLYKSYMFRDKDPVIDAVRTVVEDSKKTWSRVAQDSGVSQTTLRNWFLGDTKRPQFATVAAVVSACGMTIRIGSSQVAGSNTSKSKRKNGARPHAVR